MKRSLFLFFTSFLFASEPSVFEAGDLNAKEPYGLTKTEKAIWQNKKEIKDIKKRMYDLETKVGNLDEKVTGIQSIVEGLDERYNKLEKELKKGANEEINQEISALKNEINATIQSQKENFTQIKKILKELGSMIDQINENYVPKSEFNKELQKIYTLIKGDRLSKKSGAELYKEARIAYKKKRYKDAIRLFEASAAKKYKPATSNFYMAEACYYTKDYPCAVEHYKKSASLYANSSYMPTLLLHTAISLDRLGDKKNAKKFYENLTKLYPKSKSAAIAKRYLKRLKNSKH